MSDSEIYLDTLVAMALQEDIGPGDLTATWFVPESDTATARIIAKQPGVLAGVEAARKVIAAVDPRIEWLESLEDGAQLAIGDTAVMVKGATRALLTAERTALNFLQRLSGVATLTRKYVDAVGGLPTRILDTRKTTPGWRLLEKAAVRAGGGHNHRIGLYDRVMVKDNHLLREAQSDGMQAAIDSFKAAHPDIAVELEADTLEQVGRFLRMRGVDIILLDNMPPEQLREALALRGDLPVVFEASGGVNLDTIRGIAETGVDCISVGALTHSAPALDLSLTFADREDLPS
ncbi:MAG: carboxylating nicotinate-nucleotide diphosphorylase [Verrucomicrobiae bacterium]|nr:carboxylating nicotinate-nucleotide diphosphorylase [Verrucomicrobiae bacterium]